MTDNANIEKTGSKAPSHLVYHVRDREGDKGFFIRIGAAWAYRDDKGFTVQLDGLMPLDGRLVLRIALEKKE